MRCCSLVFVWLALSLAVELAMAGEQDVMAMRGNSGDGSVRVTAFNSTWRTVMPAPPHIDEPYAIPANNRFWAPDATPRVFRNHGYLQWKNRCSPIAPMVAGQPLDLGNTEGYGLVQPYWARPAPESEGFLALLAEVLGKGD